MLVPLSEILSPEWLHPVNGKSVHEMIELLSDESSPIKIDDNLI